MWVNSVPNFSYVGVDDNGVEVRGTAAAESEDQLAELLSRQGRYLVRSSTASAGSGVADIRILEWINKRDVIVFTSQLATIMATGVGIVEGLADIEDQIRKPAMKRVVAALRRDIESGESLSTAMAKHPKAFSDLYVNIVKAGEATGNIDRALEDLGRQLEWQAEINGRIREVSTYPILVIFMMTVLSIILVGFTIPRFLSVYERLNAQVELPLPTRIIMLISMIIRTYWPVILGAIATALVSLKLYSQSTEGAVTVSRVMSRIPIIGELTRKIALSRFSHYFATLHESGLEVAPSLALISKLIGHAHLGRQFDRAVQRVMAGESLSGALRAVGEFPPVVIQMLALGERTGRMSQALENVRKYFDGEVDRTIKRSLTLFGPIMLVVLAATFTLMALAFYLPLFRLLQGIQ